MADEPAKELRILRQALCEEVKAVRPDYRPETVADVVDASMRHQRTFSRKIVFRAISIALAMTPTQEPTQ